jgi:hypothetical protein
MLYVWKETRKNICYQKGREWNSNLQNRGGEVMTIDEATNNPVEWLIQQIHQDNEFSIKQELIDEANERLKKLLINSAQWGASDVLLKLEELVPHLTEEIDQAFIKYYQNNETKSEDMAQPD